MTVNQNEFRETIKRCFGSDNLCNIMFLVKYIISLYV